MHVQGCTQPVFAKSGSPSSLAVGVADRVLVSIMEGLEGPYVVSTRLLSKDGVSTPVCEMSKEGASDSTKPILLSSVSPMRRKRASVSSADSEA